MQQTLAKEKPAEQSTAEALKTEMKIILKSNCTEPNLPKFPSGIENLFNAMKAGKIIKSVKCCSGEDNKNRRDMDFTIKDFVATKYVVGVGTNFLKEKCDCVETDKVSEGRTRRSSFFMNWVISFELYPES